MESIIQIIRDRELFMQTYISLSDMYFLQRYTYKSEFYADYDRLLAYIHLYIPGEDRQFLVAACIGEIIDNAFTHNLGRRPTDIGPCVYLYISYQDDTITVSVWDYGVGFSGTLSSIYTHTSESAYISHALQPGITGRYQQMGGNGLVFLQQNIFNGFAGSLSIRSLETLVHVISNDTIYTEQSDIHDTIGTHIYFTLCAK